MNKTTAMGRGDIRDRARKKRQTQRLLQLALILTGALMLIGSAYWLIAGDRALLAGSEYDPADVVYGAPLRAVHEMEGPQLAAIPFLPKGGPQPAIAASELFFNLGVIGPTDIVTHEFAIFNRGEAPLTISRAYTTCGCTVAEFTATVIPPGKVALMTLTLDAGFHDVSGQTVRRGVIIENNDPNTPQMEIWVQAAVAGK